MEVQQMWCYRSLHSESTSENKSRVVELREIGCGDADRYSHGHAVLTSTKMIPCTDPTPTGPLVVEGTARTLSEILSDFRHPNL
jgi:hypothetical protein